MKKFDVRSVVRCARTGCFSARALAGTLMGFSACTGALAAGLPDPGDYVTPPPSSAVAMYAQTLKGEDVYEGGRKVAGNLGLKLDVGVVRGMHFFKFGERIADVEVILPYGRQRVSSAGFRESGLGNLTLGSTLWLQSEETSGTHTGVAAYLALPTGQSRDKGLFVSEDRYALDVEIGHVRKLASQWSLDLIAQAEVYTRDKTSRAKRDLMGRGHAHLSYHLSEASRLAIGLRQTVGARESIDGVTSLGAKNDSNVVLTWAQQVTEAWQAQVQYASDVKVRSGVPVDGLQFRLMTGF